MMDETSKYHGPLANDTVHAPQQHRQILLEVWREACRHIEIDTSTETIGKLLARQMPLEQLLVRRLETEPPRLATVAAWPAKSLLHAGEQSLHLSPEESQRLLNWGMSGRLLRRGKRLTGVLGLVLPPNVESDVLAAPLAGPDGPLGVLLLAAPHDREFEETHMELLQALREPFSAALENDRRVHEMATLREAAKAERGALLRRLGRTELGDTIVGEHGGLRQVMERVALVVDSDVPVLILGETGTGKELVARALHTRGSRQQGPFIRINCGAIPRELIDSQLFGHERGSFTGADQSRPGWFERADGGTLFLDEIGELPLEAQVRFLRVLQDGFIEPVGGIHPIHVDVRVVAATHRDLATMVRDGKFREDLWYRLAVFPVRLPPLRERREDIPALAEHFAARAAARFTLSPCQPSLSDLQLLQAYDWPGNIRELGAVIDRAAILGNGKGLEIAKALGAMDQGRIERRHTGLDGSQQPSPPPPDVDWSLDDALRKHIETVLTLTEGRVEGRRGAASLLRINPHTLRARMRKLGIRWADFRRD